MKIRALILWISVAAVGCGIGSDRIAQAPDDGAGSGAPGDGFATAGDASDAGAGAGGGGGTDDPWAVTDYDGCDVDLTCSAGCDEDLDCAADSPTSGGTGGGTGAGGAGGGDGSPEVARDVLDEWVGGEHDLEASTEMWMALPERDGETEMLIVATVFEGEVTLAAYDAEGALVARSDATPAIRLDPAAGAEMFRAVAGEAGARFVLESQTR
jgi:hypothetical protein